MKKKLESNWEMVRWLTSYIEENRESWERNWESPDISTLDTTPGPQPLVPPKTEINIDMLQELADEYSPQELQPSLVEHCETYNRGDGGAFASKNLKQPTNYSDLEKIVTMDPQLGHICLKKIDSYEIEEKTSRLHSRKADSSLETVCRDENLGLLVRKKIKELGTKPASPKNRFRNVNHLKPRSPKLGTKQLKISVHKRPPKLD